MALDFNSNVDFVDQNIRYMDELYALDSVRFDNWRDWCNANLATAIQQYEIPTNGKVVMAGTWNGNLYSILQGMFGADRCVGFDIVSYYDDIHNSIIYGDFRNIHADHSMAVDVIYNGLGTWEHNTTSKQSGLDYALNNLVSGGLYLEPKTPGAVNKLNTVAELEPLANIYDRVLIFKKI